MIIKNITHNIIIADKAQVANTFFSRLKGLLGTRKLETGKGLVIRSCSSIHTVGMKYAIDLLFLDAKDNVLKTVLKLPPGRFSLCFHSSYVVELPAGVIDATGTAVGDKLAIIEA